MRDLERYVLLRAVDRHWMDHIENMEELKQGIHLRSYAQQDPVVMYRKEGFDLFDQMIASIREETARMIMVMEIRQEQPVKRESTVKITSTGAGDGSTKRKPVVKSEAQKVGRNDPCPCGSGKKYKKCCGIDE